MKPELICSIPSFRNAYHIEIRQQILKDIENLRQYLQPLAAKFVVITDDTVANLYGITLARRLSEVGLDISLLSFPAGESSKTCSTKEYLENSMFEMGFGRDTCVLALGGGVVTDMAGYLAATYCRGIPLVMMPTTLLGMVDAAIGGKTSVNVPYGKNMLGVIYQPKKVFIDPKILTTLPLKEISNGFVEMIKHGLIADSDYFGYLEDNVQELLALNMAKVGIAIYESCRIKKDIVEQDEMESGKRRLLNFGHTVGHALECLTNYSLVHGEAVAIGILVESYMSKELGFLDSIAFERIRNILTNYGLPLKLSTLFSIEALIDAMALDKKSSGGRPRFVLLSDIGMPLRQNEDYCVHIEDALIKDTLQWMNDALCCH